MLASGMERTVLFVPIVFNHNQFRLLACQLGKLLDENSISSIAKEK